MYYAKVSNKKNRLMAGTPYQDNAGMSKIGIAHCAESLNILSAYGNSLTGVRVS